MASLRFLRRDRQRDPFAGTPLDRQPATQAMPAPAYVPHGIDTPETLADLIRQAEEAAEAIRRQEAERERLRPPGTSADPRCPGYVPSPDMAWPPARDTAQAPTEPWGPWDAPDGLLLDAKALTDGRVAPAFVPEPPLPPMPFSGVSSIWVSQIAYPAPGDLSIDAARNYARTLRHIGLATGTRGLLESEAAWPRPALETGAAA